MQADFTFQASQFHLLRCRSFAVMDHDVMFFFLKINVKPAAESEILESKVKIV